MAENLSTSAGSTLDGAADMMRLLDPKRSAVNGATPMCPHGLVVQAQHRR